MTLESVANTMKEMADLFNCSYETVWNRCMHPAITDYFTYEEVMKYIEGKEEEA